jgi:hypothetical protein
MEAPGCSGVICDWKNEGISWTCFSAFIRIISKAVKVLAGWLCIKGCGGNSIIVFVSAAFHVR